MDNLYFILPCTSFLSGQWQLCMWTGITTLEQRTNRAIPLHKNPKDSLGSSKLGCSTLKAKQEGWGKVEPINHSINNTSWSGHSDVVLTLTRVNFHCYINVWKEITFNALNLIITYCIILSNLKIEQIFKKNLFKDFK